MKRFPHIIRKIVNILGWILFFLCVILLLVALALSAPSGEEMLTFLLIVLSLLCEGYFMRNRTFGPGFMGIATFIVNRKAWPIHELLPNIPFLVHILWINLMLILLAYAFKKKKSETEMKRFWNLLSWIVFGFVMAFYILITVMPDPEVRLLDVLILYASSVTAILLVGRKWAKYSLSPGIGYGGAAFTEWILRPIMLYPLEFLSLDCPWNVVIYDMIFVAIWY